MSLCMRLLAFDLLLFSLVCGPANAGMAQAPSGETIPRGPGEGPTNRPRPADDDEKRVTQLTESIVRLRREAKFTEAIEAAGQVVAILERAVGPDHRRTADARREVEILRAIARLPEDGRRAMAGVGALWDEASSLREGNRFREAEAIRRRILGDLTRWLGEDHPDTAAGYYALAEIQFDQGRYADALPLMQKALDIRRKELGEDHLDTVDTYHQLAVIFNTNGRYADAQRSFLKALDARRKELGEDHLDTAESEFCLGANLFFQGQHADARRLIEQALDVRRRALGEDHRSVAECHLVLGGILKAEGRYADALPFLQKALDARRKALGEDHVETAESYNNLADCLSDLGRYADALPLFQRALTSLRKSVGEDHPFTATLYHNVGASLRDQGRHADALPLSRRALEIRRRVLGEDHPDTAVSYNSVAGDLCNQGRYADALPLFQRALNIDRKALGEGHATTAWRFENVAFILSHQGRYADALPVYRRALDIRRKALGETHPETARSYYVLAHCLHVQGQDADALPLGQRALDIRRTTLGTDHPSIAESLLAIAEILSAQGRYAEAFPTFERSLEVHRKTVGEDHNHIGNCYLGLGVILNKQGRYADALPWLRQALDTFRKAYGENHPSHSLVRLQLAINLEAQGRQAEALSAFEAAAAAFERSRRALAVTGLERAQTHEPSPLPAFAAALARRGLVREAWSRWEADLARGLLDDATVRELRRLTPAQRQREAELLGRLHELEAQVDGLAARSRRTQDDDLRLDRLRRERDRLQGEYLEFERALEAEHGEFAGRPAGLAQVQAALPKDVALLGWVDLTDADQPGPRHWACLLRREGDPLWVEISGTGPGQAWTKEDDRRVGELRAALRSRDPGWRELAAAVAAQRLGPLRGHLQGVGGLVVLPSPALADVPVEALLAAWPAPPQDLVVSYAPSGTMFERLTRPRPGAAAPPRLLALGDPAYPGEEPATPLLSPPNSGLAVQSIEPDGNADLAGVRPGDVLLTYDGRHLNSRADLVIRPADSPDKRVKVTLWRDGEVRALDLAAGPLGLQLDDARSAAEAVLARRSADSLLRPLIRGRARQRLSGTRGEVEAIAGLFPQGQATVLLGAAASDAALQAMARSGSLKGYRYLHFAAHGETNPDVAMSSALILAPDPGRPNDPTSPGTDGRVTAQQIAYTWELDADLVVLSACESGLGRYAHGEGYLGFAQALFIKGARSLVVSQWKVDDRATALLMERFYGNLLGRREGLRGPLAKAEALAEAKGWLRGLTTGEAGVASPTPDRGVIRPLATPGQPEPDGRRPAGPRTDGQRPYAHPYYWAAFVLVGDPGSGVP